MASRSLIRVSVNFRFLFCCLGMLSGYFLSSAHALSVFGVNGRGSQKLNVSQLETANDNLRLARTDLGAAKIPVTCPTEATVYLEGDTWDERCRKCVCTERGPQCQDPTCRVPYENRQELTCAKWENSCCCAVDGCLLKDGTTIPVDGPMPLDPEKPCHRCICKGGNRTHCLIKSCAPAGCPGAKRLPGTCCPVCPKGESHCYLPSKVWAELSTYQQRRLRTVRESRPLIIPLHNGSPGRRADKIFCFCSPKKMVATCYQLSSLKNGLRVN